MSLLFIESREPSAAVPLGLGTKSRKPAEALSFLFVGTGEGTCELVASLPFSGESSREVLQPGLRSLTVFNSSPSL